MGTRMVRRCCLLSGQGGTVRCSSLSSSQSSLATNLPALFGEGVTVWGSFFDGGCTRGSRNALAVMRPMAFLSAVHYLLPACCKICPNTAGHSVSAVELRAKQVITGSESESGSGYDARFETGGCIRGCYKTTRVLVPPPSPRAWRSNRTYLACLLSYVSVHCKLFHTAEGVDML
jgi:hypothetical protein